MEWNKIFFDESVTLNKVQGYREQQTTTRQQHQHQQQPHQQHDEESSAGGGGGGGGAEDDGDQASETYYYAEMVEEVEKVSDMLKQTQSKLWQSQDEIKTYNHTLEQKEEELHHVEQLYRDLRDEHEDLKDEVERLQSEIRDRDEGRARPELEQRLRKAIEFLKKDLEVTTEKYKQVFDEKCSQIKVIADLQQANKTLQETSEKLPTCQKQLREATEGNANLLEEVAKLREELHRSKTIAEQKDIIIRREVEGNVKEKIKLEVTKAVTKQVTDRVTRELTAKLKAERETELKILREQIRKIVKENATMKSKIDGAEKMESETKALQQDVHALTYELTRYESMIDEAKREHEMHIAQLETDFRMRLRSVKEEATKEKWESASEIRRQMTVEREREVQNFTRRIEALSKQTDRLLEQAEREKEAYGALVQKRTSQELQAEVDALAQKLEARTKESEQIRVDATKEKEVYVDQVRKTVEDEKRREISKYTHQVEGLLGEKDSLEKRIQSLEEEMAQIWDQNENQIEELRHAESEIKRLEDENFKLHRKGQNLFTVSNRYKHDAEEARKEMKKSKQLFREALLASEEANLKLKTKLRESDPGVNLSRDRYADTLRTLEEAKESLIDRVKLYEEENATLNLRNEELRQSLDEMIEKDQNENQSCPGSHAIETIESSNMRLRHKIASFESLLGNFRAQGGASVPGNELFLAIESEYVQLKAIIEDTSVSLRSCRKVFQQSPSTSASEINRLSEQLANMAQIMEEYRDHRTIAAQELRRVKQSVEESLAVSSEDDTVPSNVEFHTLDRMLGELEFSARSSSSKKTEGMNAEGHTNTVTELKEVERLKSEVGAFQSLLGISSSSSSQKTSSSSSSGMQQQAEQEREEMEPALRNYYYESLRSELEVLRSDKSKLENQSEYHQRENQKKLEAAHAEIRGWRNKVHALENELRRHRKEFDKSKEMYEDALYESEEEILRLKSHMEVVASANHNYHDETKSLESVKKELEKAVETERVEKETLAMKMDDVLRKAKDENMALRARMEASERAFLNTLRQKEDEISELKTSLDDVKTTLLGQSSEESSSSCDHSSSSRMISTRSVGSGDGAEQQRTVGGDLPNASGSSSNSLDESEEESSTNILCRFDDLVVQNKKKKQVSWKKASDEESGVDAATGISNSSSDSDEAAADHTSAILRYGSARTAREAATKGGFPTLHSSTMKVKSDDESHNEILPPSRHQRAGTQKKAVSWEDIAEINPEKEMHERRIAARTNSSDEDHDYDYDYDMPRGRRQFHTNQEAFVHNDQNKAAATTASAASADDEYREPSVTEEQTTTRRRLDHKRTDLREAPTFDVVQEEDDGGGAPDDEGSTTSTIDWDITMHLSPTAAGAEDITEPSGSVSGSSGSEEGPTISQGDDGGGVLESRRHQHYDHRPSLYGSDIIPSAATTMTPSSGLSSSFSYSSNESSENISQGGGGGGGNSGNEALLIPSRAAAIPSSVPTGRQRRRRGGGEGGGGEKTNAAGNTTKSRYLRAREKSAAHRRRSNTVSNKTTTNPPEGKETTDDRPFDEARKQQLHQPSNDDNDDFDDDHHQHHHQGSSRPAAVEETDEMSGATAHPPIMDATTIQSNE